MTASALAQTTASTPSAAAASAPSAEATVTRDQLVALYQPRLADRPRAIGQALFEAAFQGGYQFNTIQGFGEVPDLRYGITDQLEVTLLGVRYIVVEDARNIPGLALRAQLHDLAYQNHNGTNTDYPLLRPGGFFEFRDRLPFHLAFNAVVGYEFSVQTSSPPSSAQLQGDRNITTATAPLLLEGQWSPLPLFSVTLRGGYLVDTYQPSFQGPTQSEGLLTLAAVYNTSRFDLRVYYTSNWFDDARLGYVPEVGAGAGLRL